ncbi:MAG TPA: hypothetical protein VJ927_12405 [Actinomycetota bacterium]|nr:hypothetical protein [Actinomycetota bacterium]
MRRLVQRYIRWRGASIVRHASFISATALTTFSLVVLPGQWIPVLFRDDLTVIGLSLVILGLGSLVSTKSLARRARFETRTCLTVSLTVAGVLVVGASALHKTLFDGIGRPEPIELVLGVAFVGVCALLGAATGRLLGRGPRAFSSIATVAVVIVAAAAGVWLFSYFLPKTFEPNYVASEQRCEVRNGIEYCANPGYEPFIDRWQPVVETVIAATPVEVERSEILIAQMLDNNEMRVDDSSASPGLDWGRGAGTGVAELALGLDMANWVTGLDTQLVSVDPAEPQITCDQGNNARSVVAYWLAGQVGPAAETVIGELGCCADAISGSTFGAPATGGDYDLAVRLLARPSAQVSTGIAKHWDELVDPETSTARLGEIFDLDIEETGDHGSDEAPPACASRFG